MAILFTYVTVFSQNVNIPDANFLNARIDQRWDTNGDSLISYEETDLEKQILKCGDNQLRPLKQ